jgi:hypothetical protein
MVSMDKLKIIDDITQGSPNRLRESYFIKYHKDVYDNILIYTKNISDIRFPYKVWHWVNNESNYITCYCGRRVSEKMNWREGYKKYCSNKCSANSQETKDKLKNTSLEKWGVEHYSKTIEYVQKVKNTSIERFGVDNYAKTSDFIEKSKKTFLSKWGVDSFTKTSEYLEKSKKTSLINWGVDFPIQSDIIKERIKNSNIKKYGVSHIFESNNYRDLNFNISLNPNYISYDSGLNLFNCDCGEQHTFNIKTDDYYGRLKSNNKLCTVCYPISSSPSVKEKMLLNFIKSVYDGEIISNFRSGSLEIDIYLPQLNIGFEFNGIWWHSDRYKDKWYHIKKTDYFKNIGIRIFHIWEDDWINNNEILKSQIRNWLMISKNKIWARNCDIVELTNCNKFLNENHIQGSDRSNIKIGLLYNGKVVSVMTFNKSEGRRKMVDGEWNLSRFCNKLDTNVVGGASKLLKYFIKNWIPNRIVSYADKDWSNGGLYLNIGFKLLYETDTDYKYIINDKRIHKSRFRKSNLKTDLSENNYMSNIPKVWDCGKMKFELLLR